jgi:hypothetical protein
MAAKERRGSGVRTTVAPLVEVLTEHDVDELLGIRGRSIGHL